MEVSPGFLLLLGLLFWLDEGVGLLPWGLLSCALHEMGHAAAAVRLGGRVRELRLTAVGAELRLDYLRPLGYAQDSLVALAGPAVNLACGALAMAAGWELCGAAALVIAGFNLLPIPPLDGGRVAYDLLAWRLDPDWADRLTAALSGCLLGGLVGLGAVAAARFANFTLLLTALWLLLGALRRSGG